MLMLAWLGGVSMMVMAAGLMRHGETLPGWTVWFLGFAVLLLQRVPGVFNA